MNPIARRGVLTCGLALAGAALTSPAQAAAPKAATEAVDINFAAVAGTAPVSCGTAIPGLGTTRQAAQLLDRASSCPT